MVEIRPAVPQDAARMAALCTELGYPEGLLALALSGPHHFLEPLG